ncbi:MAG: pseudouridine synthase [Ignavibacteriaceae bacterium]
MNPTEKTQSTQVRLNSYIADCGVTSRRKADELIQQGRVTVNNKTITALGFKVNPEQDKVFVDGERINLQLPVYFLLNKPKGYVSTASDDRGRAAVVDLIKTNVKIYPVGRLDYDTTGVLILTNDGDFSQALAHPSNNIQREYDVKLDRMLTEEDEAKLLKGVFIEGVRGKFVSVLYPTNNHKSPTVKTTEGRNHFVKNMFKTLGYTVTGLHRRSFGILNVKDMPEGSYRELTIREVQTIKKYVK